MANIERALPENDRPYYRDIMQEKKGIQKVNSELKVLKYRYQEFAVAFAELIGLGDQKVFYDFKSSEKLQSMLSQYIHTYTRTEEEMTWNSHYIKSGIKAITETFNFIIKNTIINGYNFRIANVRHDLPEHAEVILNDWKTGKIKDADELKRLLSIIPKET